MEIAFAGGALAKVAHCNPGLSIGVLYVLHLQGVCRASCMRDLSRKRGANRVDVELFAAVMHRHVSAQTIVFGIGEELVHKRRQREAALEINTRLAVLTENNVGRRQGAGRSNRDAFFARGDLERAISLSCSLGHTKCLRKEEELPCKMTTVPAAVPQT